MNKPSLSNIFWAFLKLGCTSFGGPVAHLGYFYESLIQQKQWLKPEEYSALVGLCHFIPGPSSSQVGIGMGYQLQGWKGAIAAWLGFTLPSALLMTLLAIGLLNNPALFSHTQIGLLKLIAIAVVFQAIIQMSRVLLPKWSNRLLCIVCFFSMLMLGGHYIISQWWVPYIVMLASGLIGAIFLRPMPIVDHHNINKPLNYTLTVLGLFIFSGLLLLLPLLTQYIHSPLLDLFDSLYRIGATVFGGGHVVLPLMQQAITQQSVITSDEFLIGYSLAQAVPGPLFTVASYMGALWLNQSPWLGAGIATIAIFLPSFIIIPSLLQAWKNIQHHQVARGILAGFNAAVIALLCSVLYQPLLVSSVHSTVDVMLIIATLIYLFLLKWPIWIAILLVVVIGFIGL